MKIDLEDTRRRCRLSVERAEEIYNLISGNQGQVEWADILGSPETSPELVVLIDSIFEEGVPSYFPKVLTITTIQSGDQRLTVHFTSEEQPIPLDKIEVSYGGGVWSDVEGTSSPILLTGLTNGQQYNVRLRATNRFNTSEQSNIVSATPSEQPASVPEPPIALPVTVGDEELVVPFLLSGDGGAIITDVEYQLNLGAWVSSGGTTSPIIISSLTNGQQYQVNLRAINSVGGSIRSNGVQGTPVTVPDAPTLDGAEEGDTEVTLLGTINNTGGSPITDLEYQVDGGVWVSAGKVNFPITVGGLTNTTQYQFRVRVVNAIGESPQSNDILATPQAFSTITITDVEFTGPGEITISWDATEGPIFNVDWRLDGGAWTQFPSQVSPGVIDGLDPGGSYILELRAENTLGYGVPSAPFPINITGSEIPQNGLLRHYDSETLAGLSDGSAVSQWEDQSQYGAHAIQTGVERPAKTTVNLKNPTPQVRFDGVQDWLSLGNEGITTLDDELSLWIVSRARQRQETAIISSHPQDPSNRLLVHLPYYYNNEDLVVFDFGDRDGNGRMLEPYDYPFNSFGIWEFRVTGTQMEIRRNGKVLYSEPFSDSVNLAGQVLRMGYTFGQEFFEGDMLFKALYNKDLSSQDRTTLFDILRTKYGFPRVPDDPTIDNIFSRNEELLVEFSTDWNAGTSGPKNDWPFTDVEYRLDGGSWVSAGTTDTSFIIVGLTNDQAYDVEIRLINGLGEGLVSNLVSGTPEAIAPPAAPTITDFAEEDQQVRIYFSFGDPGGAPITDVEYRLDAGSWVSFGGISSPQTITGLTNSQQYDVAIRAVNSGGESPASNTVSVTPDTLEITTFAVPGPTIMDAFKSGSNLVVEWDVVNLSDKVNMPDVWYGFWDHPNAPSADDGEAFIGMVNHGKVSQSQINLILGQGLKFTFRKSCNEPRLWDRSLPNYVGDNKRKERNWESEANSAKNALQGINPDLVTHIILEDEPSTGKGWSQARLEECINVFKNIVGEQFLYGFTYTTGSVKGYSGTTGPWPNNAGVHQANYYAYGSGQDGYSKRLSNDSEGDFKSASNQYGFPVILNAMAQKLNDQGAPTSTMLGINLQAFGNDIQNKYRMPPSMAPIWAAEVINDFNNGVYDDHGFKVGLFEFYEFWSREPHHSYWHEGMETVPEMFNNAKKIDVFGRPSENISQVRITVENSSGSIVDQITTSNDGQHSISGLSSGSTYNVYVQAVVGGQFSAKSNIVRVSM